MDGGISFNIGEIKIVVKKREEQDFSFENPCRSHDGFVLITEGQGKLTLPDMGETDVFEGDVIFLTKGEKYKLCFNEPCAYVTTAFRVISNEDSPRLTKIYKASKYDIENIERAAELWQKQSFDSQLDCRIRLMKLYLAAFRTASLSKSQSSTRLAEDYIRDNFKRNFSSDEIAKACSLSPSHLRAKFVENNGVTITEYRDMLRLGAAKEMLSSAIFSIKDIAEELGFCDVYYFSKFFKSRLGIAPAEYRRKNSL